MTAPCASIPPSPWYSRQPHRFFSFRMEYTRAHSRARVFYMYITTVKKTFHDQVSPSTCVDVNILRKHLCAIAPKNNPAQRMVRIPGRQEYSPRRSPAEYRGIRFPQTAGSNQQRAERTVPAAHRSRFRKTPAHRHHTKSVVRPEVLSR